jgi:hypothetical protein
MRTPPNELPNDFPPGTRYVVEGDNDADGRLYISARYVLLPDLTRIDLPTDPEQGFECSESKPQPARRSRKAARPVRLVVNAR